MPRSLRTATVLEANQKLVEDSQEQVEASQQSHIPLVSRKVAHLHENRPNRLFVVKVLPCKKSSHMIAEDDTPITSYPYR